MNMNRIPSFGEFCLNEGLIQSYDSSKVVKLLNKVLGKYVPNIVDNSGQEILITIINKYTNEEILDVDIKIKSILSVCGWFIDSYVLYPFNSDGYNISQSLTGNVINSNIERIIFRCERKFNKEDSIPPKLYHLSMEHLSPKIHKSGLIPRDKNKMSYHPKRIYVCKNIQDCETLKPNMYSNYSLDKFKKNNPKNNEPKVPSYIIYEIDTSGDYISKLYHDKNYKQKGYYILDNIPPSKLKIVKKL